jgi:hypothetical protein
LHNMAINSYLNKLTITSQNLIDSIYSISQERQKINLPCAHSSFLYLL